MGGTKIEPVRADSTCVDAAAAQAAAERLVTSEKSGGDFWGFCSGATTAVAQNVAVPNGVPAGHAILSDGSGLVGAG
ncbi:MAG: hypothetical protein R3E95_08025 [Thiolinea sp.]